MKKHGNSAAGIVLVLALLLAVPMVGSAEPGIDADTVIKLINQDRARYGLQPLKPNPLLAGAAYKKGRHMMQNSYFAHNSPDGTSPWDFIRQEKLMYKYAGENLALGYVSSYELEKDLMASPSHRKNLLSSLFSEVGVAIVNGEYNGQNTVMVVQMFAQPSDILGLKN